ncbi:MAG TPA: Hsp20/alpha crystallin family protein [bacterium]|nr:Hsp20/alpha crystallin family protein [bacterium]HPV65619.1 Hsp20/alpha crystallin family protein [bacterium]
MINIFKNDRQNFNKVETHEENDGFSPEWLKDDLPEGQLLLDVYQTDDKIIVKSTMAGVSPENLFISLNHDMLTIKGRRDYDHSLDDSDCLMQECYWGSFSRTVILPEEVDSKKIEAILENGVLTVSLERVYKNRQIKVKIKA